MPTWKYWMTITPSNTLLTLSHNLYQERRSGRLAYLVMHGSPLRPQDVDEGVSHYENNSMELQMIEEEPMLQRDFRQLQELIARLRDILS